MDGRSRLERPFHFGADTLLVQRSVIPRLARPCLPQAETSVPFPSRPGSQMRNLRRWKRFRGADALALDDGVDVVGGQILQFFCCAAGPLDFDRIELLCLAQAEMKAQVVLRKVTRAAAHFIELHQLSRLHRHPRSNSGAIAFAADQLE